MYSYVCMYMDGWVHACMYAICDDDDDDDEDGDDDDDDDDDDSW